MRQVLSHLLATRTHIHTHCFSLAPPLASIFPLSLHPPLPGVALTHAFYPAREGEARRALRVAEIFPAPPSAGNQSLRLFRVGVGGGGGNNERLDARTHARTLTRCGFPRKRDEESWRSSLSSRTAPSLPFPRDVFLTSSSSWPFISSLSSPPSLCCRFFLAEKPRNRKILCQRTNPASPPPRAVGFRLRSAPSERGRPSSLALPRVAPPGATSWGVFFFFFDGDKTNTHNPHKPHTTNGCASDSHTRKTSFSCRAKPLHLLSCDSGALLSLSVLCVQSDREHFSPSTRLSIPGSLPVKCLFVTPPSFINTNNTLLSLLYFFCLFC